MAEPYYPPNADYPLSGRIQLVAARSPMNLPNVAIPDGFEIAIKSWPANPVGGYINVGKSRADVLNQDESWPLIPNESISYGVKDAKELWVSATAGPAWVCWTVEQRRGG
jgi:hypothetical protein